MDADQAVDYAAAGQAAADAAVEALCPDGTAVDLVRSLAVRDSFMQSALGRSKPEHWKYGSVIELVLAEGAAFSVEDVRYVEGIDGTPKNCFQDALDLAMEHRYEGWSYAEGYAIGIACLDVHHAWCVDAEGKVVDPTWQAVAAEHSDESFPAAGAAYVGVVLRPEVAWGWVAVKGSYGVFDWMAVEPLMESGLDALPDAW